MKHRFGFVSNSSSSSFCILGIPVTSEQFEEVGINEPWDSYDKLKELGLNLERGIDTYYEEWVIGINPNSLLHDKGNLSINKIREEVRDNLSKLFNKEIDIEEVQFRSDGGHD